MPTITTSDGVRLHYTDSGDGAQVVLLAGFTAPATSWVLQERALLDAGYRVLALDRRSHGRSDSPDHGQRMARHGKDLWDFLTAVDVRDAVLVGGSMGASATWAYSDLFGAERVRGLVGIDQTPKMLNDDDWASGFYGLTRQNVGVFFANGIPDDPPVRRPATALRRSCMRVWHLALTIRGGAAGTGTGTGDGDEGAGSRT